MRFRLAALFLAALPLLVAPSARAAEVQYFPVQAGDHPHDVAPAPDGSVWYTGQAAGVLGRLDPKTGSVERIPLGAGSAPHGVIVGPDGAAWVTDGGLNAIVRVDPSSKAVKVWPLPATRPNANLNTPTFDGKGRIWFTAQAGIYGRLDPQTGKMDVWHAPKGLGPYGITATPDGEIYYVSLAGSFLGRPDLETGATTAIEPACPMSVPGGCGRTPRGGFGSANGTPAISASTILPRRTGRITDCWARRRMPTPSLSTTTTRSG
jgi:virginiamycin B lyase